MLDNCLIRDKQEESFYCFGIKGIIVGSFIYILLIVSYDLSLNRIVRENMGKFMFIDLKKEISLLIVIICFVSFVL